MSCCLCVSWCCAAFGVARIAQVTGQKGCLRFPSSASYDKETKDRNDGGDGWRLAHSTMVLALGFGPSKKTRKQRHLLQMGMSLAPFPPSFLPLHAHLDVQWEKNVGCTPHRCSAPCEPTNMHPHSHERSRVLALHPALRSVSTYDTYTFEGSRPCRALARWSSVTKKRRSHQPSMAVGLRLGHEK